MIAQVSSTWPKKMSACGAFQRRSIGTGDSREMFAPIDNRALVADAEGVALWPSEAQWRPAGGLQPGRQRLRRVRSGDRRALVARFEISGGEIDRTTETDGIEVHALPLPGYPEGVFLAQDDAEDSGGQNFKIVDLAAVRAAIEGWSAPAE
jgi:3-phytase